MVSVTSVFSIPGLTSLSAASEAKWAAIMTSALRPVTGASAVAPSTQVWATTAMKPSMWAPRSSLIRSPSARLVSGSDRSGV